MNKQAVKKTIKELRCFKQDRTNPGILPHKSVLQSMGITQRHIADMLGTSPQYVNNVLNGTVVSNRLIEKITDWIELNTFLLLK